MLISDEEKTQQPSKAECYLICGKHNRPDLFKWIFSTQFPETPSINHLRVNHSEYPSLRAEAII